MDYKSLIKELLKKRSWSYSKLAEEIGVKGYLNVSSYLNRPHNLNFSLVLRIMNSMGYDVVIRDKYSKEEFKL